VGAKDLAADRFRLLIEQLVAEGKSQHEIAKLLGISQGTVSFNLKEQRSTGIDVIGKAMTRLKIRPAFFFDASLERPHYVDYQDTVVENDWTDSDAWVELERTGRIEYFRRAGVAEENIQRVRRWKWRGRPAPRDYERLLEADLLGAQHEPAVELDEARARRRAEGKQAVPLRPKK
jgi:transcriptional regulator with XRE-family HTH domain